MLFPPRSGLWRKMLASLTLVLASGAARSEELIDLSLPSRGGLQVTPYGAFWADMVYETRRTQPGSFTLFVPALEDQGESAFALDARRTRLGLDVHGPGLNALVDSVASGRAEIDFYGNFVTENRAGVLLRHAFWEVHNDTWKFLVGQTDDVISPLSPQTINYAVGYNAGNIGFRRAQFRAERTTPVGSDSLWQTQFSLNQDIVADFQTEAAIRREASNWPLCEGRTALALWPTAGEPAVGLGLSGHIGETGFDFLELGPAPNFLPIADDVRFLTWSCNVDFSVRLHDRGRIRGEFFHGANLSPFLGGIGQGVCPCLRVPIRATGGWIELAWDWTPSWHTHVGMGIDDPRNLDSLVGRIYNRQIYTNVVVDLSPQLMTGLELSSWKTLYHDVRTGLIPDADLIASSPGKSWTLDWTVRYSF